jgi:hypothetical protein
MGVPHPPGREAVAGACAMSRGQPTSPDPGSFGLPTSGVIDGAGCEPSWLCWRLGSAPRQIPISVEPGPAQVDRYQQSFG